MKKIFLFIVSIILLGNLLVGYVNFGSNGSATTKLEVSHDRFKKVKSLKKNIDIDENKLNSLDEIDSGDKAKYSKLIDETILENVHYDDNCIIVSKNFGDFNNDGIIEAIVGIKASQTCQMFSQLLYLEFISFNEYKILDELNVSELGEFGIVNIKDLENSVLYVNRIISASCCGFNLYELNGKNFNFIYAGSPDSDKGLAFLHDSDNDDIYDGYTLIQYGLNVYYNMILTEWEFYKEPDKLGSQISAFIYNAAVKNNSNPVTPKEVLIQYAHLSSIKSMIRGKNFEIVGVVNLDERLNELCKGGFKDEEGIIYDSTLLQSTELGIEPRLDFDVQIRGNHARAKSIVIGDVTGIYNDNLIEYELQKINDKWVIVSQR